MKKKNIVIINPDQMRYDYLSHTGHPFIETKNISRLAEMGTWFSDCYCSCPMCGPSRTSFVTGKYPSEHGVRNYSGTMNPSLPNALYNLKNAGYRRAIHGKDHIIHQNAVGILYDEGEDICIGNLDKHPLYKHSWSSNPLEDNDRYNITGRLTRAGLDFIDRQADKDEPFFLTLNYNDPHPYFSCPEPYASMFSPDQFELPPNFRREPDSLEPRRLSIWRKHSRSDLATEEDFKKAMAMYSGQIRYVDDMTGLVLDKLAERNLLDNTIIIFWSDHGEFLGDYGVTHKQLIFYDCLVKIPMIIYDPDGSLPQGRFDDLTEAMDIFATILDMAGVPQVQGSRAQSLLSPEYSARSDVFAEGGLYFRTPDHPFEKYEIRAPHDPSQWGPGAMLRNKEFKLCVYSDDQGELFDLKNDPYEIDNLFDNPDCAEIKSTMMHRMIRRQTCLGQAPEMLPKHREDARYDRFNVYTD